MAKRPIESSKPLEWVRVSLFFLGCVLSVLGVVFAPKELLSEPALYTSAVSMADTTNDSLVLFDYKVYGTQRRMDADMPVQIADKLAQFKVNDDVLVVKVQGTELKTEVFDEYVLVHDPETIELNIEFYAAKNVKAMGSSLPTRTFIKLARDLLKKATVIYLCLVVLIAFALFLPCSIYGTKALLRLIGLYRKPKTESGETE